MARAKTEVKTVAEAVKTEDLTVTAALQAEIERLEAENAALHAETENLRLQIEQLEALAHAPSENGNPNGAETLPEYVAGTQPPAEDAEVVAVKSRHGHAFWRAGYQVLPEWTFVRRADFEADDFARLTGDRMSLVREAVKVGG